ncbi:hypothetical protein Taro_020958 [Colocasia esculenta]|uniref:Disease resistance N-terminal domain-containing protein n=1 Tax=Colocasia esculenta TaxID=4460 RepID=A0A843VA20_COLES|nr:hypothetical protein [Colocasia esculenta]
MGLDAFSNLLKFFKPMECGVSVEAHEPHRLMHYIRPQRAHLPFVNGYRVSYCSRRNDHVRLRCGRCAKLCILRRQEFNSVWYLKDEINKIYESVVTIQGVVEDAEKKLLQDEDVRKWIRDLKNAGYDMEDALCD